MTPDETIYVNYIPTVGDFDPLSDDIQTIGTGLTPSETPSANAIPEQNERVNEIIANRGRIGNWRIEQDSLHSGNVYLRGTDGKILIGSAADADAKIFIDGANEIIRVGPSTGDYITIDGVNQRIRSSNYSTGVSGFTVEPDLVEAQNIRARGVLQSAVFQKDIVSAIGGQLLVANADALDADMTASDSSNLTIKGDTTFAVNDILRIKDGVDDEYLRVTNIGSAPTYTVTRDLGSAYSANANPTWKKGQAVVKQGSSDGSSTFSGGWLQLFGEGTNSPYYSVFKRTGVAYNAFTEVIRIGNLNGFLDYVADEFGIGMGDSDDFIAIDPTNGVRLNTPVNVDIPFTAGEDLSIRDAVGIFGEIVETSLAVAVSQAVRVEEDNATTNFDGGVLNISDTDDGRDNEILASYSSMPAIPSGTGITVTSIEVKVYLFEEDNGSDQCVPDVHPNTGTFTEGTVTWNTKPSYDASSVGSMPAYSNSNSYVDTGWVTITSTQYNNIRTNGVTIRDAGTGGTFLTAEYSDEDGNTTANAPKIDVRFTYTIQDGRIYKTKAETSDEASGFMGIALSGVSEGASVNVRTEGKVDGFTGLTPSSNYYLSDTDGAIADSAGSVSKVVGRALSTTELQVKYSLS